MFFGHGGVFPQSVKTGLQYVAFTTWATYVNMQPFQVDENFDDLMSRDGVPLDFHAVARFQVVESVPLILKFGEDWYQKNVKSEFQKLVRDEVKKHGMNETAISAVAAEEIDAAITANLQAYIKAIQLPVDLRGVTLGRANPPDAIKDQRIATATQEQRANTEHQRKLAEDQRKEAEAARAISDNSYREAMRLTPEQFLQLEQIKMLHEVCAGGKCTFLMGGNVVPTIPVR
jgi:regulator of protease activity HflC (stomatin/prohibitin superfamily)